MGEGTSIFVDIHPNKSYNIFTHIALVYLSEMPICQPGAYACIVCGFIPSKHLTSWMTQNDRFLFLGGGGGTSVKQKKKKNNKKNLW